MDRLAIKVRYSGINYQFYIAIYISDVTGYFSHSSLGWMQKYYWEWSGIYGASQHRPGINHKYPNVDCENFVPNDNLMHITWWFLKSFLILKFSYISHKFLFTFVSVHPCDKADKAGCEQTCNKKGVEAQCACEEGFLLKEDGKTCKESKLNYRQLSRQLNDSIGCAHPHRCPTNNFD